MDKNVNRSESMTLSVIEDDSEGRKQPERRSLLGDVRGLTTVEYIIILCLIAVVGFGVWQKFGEKVRTKTDNSANQMEELPNATPPAE